MSYQDLLNADADRSMDYSDDYTEERMACGLNCTVHTENGKDVKVDVPYDFETMTCLFDFSESFRELFAKELGITSVDDVEMNIGE